MTQIVMSFLAYPCLKNQYLLRPTSKAAWAA